MKYAIMSYPRSGNHWVRYIIEWLSGQPTLGAGTKEQRDKNDRPILQFLGLKYRNPTNIAIKMHKLAPGYKHLKPILIIRNYKEAIVRHKQHAKYKSAIDKYIILLKHYDSWSKKKLLIYYEDMITSPTNEIIRIANFIGFEDKCSEFIDKYDIHKSRCLKLYDKKYKSVTGGKHVVFHSLHSDINNKCDKYLKDSYSVMAKKYLKRYL